MQDESDATTARLWSFATAEFNEAEYTLRVGGAAVELDAKTLEVLRLLLEHAGEVVTKEELFESVWAGRVTVDGVLTNAISRLRRVLGDEQQTLIVTHHRIGYRLAVPVVRKRIGRSLRELQLKAGEAVPGREHWRLVAPLGQGSEVWCAEQVKTGERRVFKFAVDGTRLSSLKREATLYRLMRQVLGERPDLARVLEWNFDHSPFFLECEYGGESLSDWAQTSGGLSAQPLELRLRLMAQIAEAVAAAHSAGVLHKDLKPGNVLIYGDAEGQPQARLTDFGSGRLADPDALDELGITRLGFTLGEPQGDSTSGTPLYLAPELLAGMAPTQAGDVYALGVMLYQMVVGDLRRPLAAGWEREVEDPLLREDIALAAAGDPARRLDSARGLAQRLARLPQRRREQAAALRQQIEQQAAQRLLERARVRRPWVLSMLAAVVLGVAVGVYFFRAAVVSRDQAVRELETSQAVLSFLEEDLLKPAIKGQRMTTRNVTVLDALKDAARLIDQRFSKQPNIAANLYALLGEGISNFGDPQSALDLFSRADALFVQTGAGNQLEPISIAMDIANMRIRLQDFDRAREELENVQKRIDEFEGDSTLLLGIWYYLQGEYFTRRHEVDAAFDALEKSVDLIGRFQVRHGEVSEPLKTSARNAKSAFATALSVKGRHKEAAEIMEEALRECIEAFNPASPLCFVPRFRLTAIYKKGALKDAKTVESSLLELRENIYAQGHDKDFVLINIAEEMAEVYISRYEWDAAIKELEFAHMLYVDLRGSDTPPSALTAAAVGHAEFGKGSLDLAEQWIWKSLEMGGDSLAELPIRHYILLNLAEILAEKGDDAAAARTLDEIDLGAVGSLYPPVLAEARASIVRACVSGRNLHDGDAALKSAREKFAGREAEYSGQLRLAEKCAASNRGDYADLTS